jgi:hypothetical protein
MIEPPWTPEQRKQVLDAMQILSQYGFISIDFKRYMALKAWLDLTGGWPTTGWYGACDGQPEAQPETET